MLFNVSMVKVNSWIVVVDMWVVRICFNCVKIKMMGMVKIVDRNIFVEGKVLNGIMVRCISEVILNMVSSVILILFIG